MSGKQESPEFTALAASVKELRDRLGDRYETSIGFSKDEESDKESRQKAEEVAYSLSLTIGSVDTLMQNHGIKL